MGISHPGVFVEIPIGSNFRIISNDLQFPNFRHDYYRLVTLW